MSRKVLTYLCKTLTRQLVLGANLRNDGEMIELGVCALLMNLLRDLKDLFHWLSPKSSGTMKCD